MTDSTRSRHTVYSPHQFFRKSPLFLDFPAALYPLQFYGCKCGHATIGRPKPLLNGTMTANFKKRMLYDYKVGSETTTEVQDGSADSPNLQPTPKRLRLAARAVHIDTQNISTAVEARQAVNDLRQQLQVSVVTPVSQPEVHCLYRYAECLC